MLSASQAATRR